MRIETLPACALALAAAACLGNALRSPLVVVVDARVCAQMLAANGVVRP